MKYTAPIFLFNAHLETIVPSLLRRVGLKAYHRERITTPDDDFLDLDWLTQESKKLLIISHGLEGSSSRPYVKGLARAAYGEGFDVLAWNFRGCSGEINRQRRFYHSGATDDLDTVVTYCIGLKRYTQVYLAGFSLGGNLTLKYMGERTTDPLIQKAVVFSVPMHLHSSCLQIARPSNRIYANRFLRSLKKKVIQKHNRFPDLPLKELAGVKTILEFDDLITAPVHGFQNAVHYYESNSSLYFMPGIAKPTLIINAKNDPFLSSECFPEKQLEGHPFVTLEIPERGGHVGFTQFNGKGLYWSEERAIRFLMS